MSNVAGSRRNTQGSSDANSGNKFSVGGARKNSEMVEEDEDQLTEEQILEIKEAFSMFDTDGDGVITQKEFYQALEVLGSPLTEAEAAAALQEMDIDENGKVDFAEFLECIANKLQDEATEEEIIQAFKIFDKDNSGTISAAEFKSIMMNMGQRMEESEVNEMLFAADTNGDGVIDYKEFARMLDTGRSAVTPLLPEK